MTTHDEQTNARPEFSSDAMEPPARQTDPSAAVDDPSTAARRTDATARHAEAPVTGDESLTARTEAPVTGDESLSARTEAPVTRDESLSARTEAPVTGDESLSARAEPSESRAEPSSAKSLFADDDLSSLRSRWDDVQAAFVDDPKQCVQKADALVAKVVEQLTAGFSDARTRLEAQWARGEDASTEDLRLALKRYREFFQRLLSV
jgi:hypothetical protein